MVGLIMLLTFSLIEWAQQPTCELNVSYRYRTMRHPNRPKEIPDRDIWRLRLGTILISLHLSFERNGKFTVVASCTIGGGIYPLKEPS